MALKQDPLFELVEYLESLDPGLLVGVKLLAVDHVHGQALCNYISAFSGEALVHPDREGKPGVATTWDQEPQDYRRARGGEQPVQAEPQTCKFVSLYKLEQAISVQAGPPRQPNRYAGAHTGL